MLSQQQLLLVLAQIVAIDAAARQRRLGDAGALIAGSFTDERAIQRTEVRSLFGDGAFCRISSYGAR